MTAGAGRLIPNRMFRCTITDEDALDADVLQGNDEYIVNVEIGFDDEVGTVYNAFVVLAPRPGMLDLRVFDLGFSIVEAQPDGSHIDTWWDGSRSRAVIVDPEDRIRVMGAVCAAVGCLINVAEPLGIKMQTHTADLPLKALMKYDRVSTVFTDRGYEGGKTEHYHGLWFYEFERVATVSNVSPDEPLSTDDPEGI